MCIFCSAIPAVMAAGVSLKVKQDQEMKQFPDADQPAKAPLIDAGVATAVAIVGLLASASLVHVQQGG